MNRLSKGTSVALLAVLLSGCWQYIPDPSPADIQRDVERKVQALAEIGRLVSGGPPPSMTVVHLELLALDCKKVQGAVEQRYCQYRVRFQVISSSPGQEPQMLTQDIREATRFRRSADVWEPV